METRDSTVRDSGLGIPQNLGTQTRFSLRNPSPQPQTPARRYEANGNDAIIVNQVGDKWE
jgi:hypothetical protein